MVPEALSEEHIRLSHGCRQIYSRPIDLRRSLDPSLAPSLYKAVFREDVGYRALGLRGKRLSQTPDPLALDKVCSSSVEIHCSYAVALRRYIVPSAVFLMTIWISVPLLWCQGSLEIQSAVVRWQPKKVGGTFVPNTKNC